MCINKNHQYLLICIVLFSCGRSEQTAEDDAEQDQSSGAGDLITVPDEEGKEIDTSTWQTYSGKDINISFKYPQDWQLAETSGPFRIINAYSSKNAKNIDPPLKIHEEPDITYLSVFPDGYGTETPSGKQKSYFNWQGSLPTEFEIAENNSTVFLLESGEPWAFLIRPASASKEWGEQGYIFAQIKADTVSITCYDKETGKKLEMKDCEPLMGDTIKRDGNISRYDKRVLMKIFESMYFFDDSADRKPVGELIQIEEPQPNTVIESPLTVKGKARGYWYFEASFPVELVDKDGKMIATGIAQAEGDWMTEDFVPFSLTLNFDSPDAQRGHIIFKRSNASGMPEHDRSLRLPVKFR